ncbi:MAG: HAD family hydrolase [Candidatus Micrarchaeota archaeon]|nr:HAD family hydrolase [Candidatus Micrarchaeota archaeon]
MDIKSFDLIIFDLDGTLVDNRVAIVNAYKKALEEFGYAYPGDKWVWSRIGAPVHDAFVAVTKGVEEGKISEMVDVFRDAYIKDCDKGVEVLPGAVELLTYLRKNGFKTGLATTKGNAGAQELLKRAGLIDYFDVAVGLTDEFRPKPDPSMLDYIIGKLGVERSRTMYVGDTPIDMAAARNAKVKSVAVMTGIDIGATTLQELKSSNPDIMMQSLSDLSAYLY